MTLIATQPQLGLVCITVSKEVRYRTITRKRLLDLSEDGQQRALEDIYRDNIQSLDNALRYCEREGIRLYRMPSSIFPFADMLLATSLTDAQRNYTQLVKRSGERLPSATTRSW